MCVYVCVCVCIDIRVCVYTYTHTMEYYSAIKKNEILPFVTTWMDLEGIVLSEISQTEKDNYHVIFLIYRINKKAELMETENRLMMVARGKGWEGGQKG